MCEYINNENEPLTLVTRVVLIRSPNVLFYLLHWSVRYRNEMINYGTFYTIIVYYESVDWSGPLIRANILYDACRRSKSYKIRYCTVHGLITWYIRGLWLQNSFDYVPRILDILCSGYFVTSTSRGNSLVLLPRIQS